MRVKDFTPWLLVAMSVGLLAWLWHRHSQRQEPAVQLDRAEMYHGAEVAFGGLSMRDTMAAANVEKTLSLLQSPKAVEPFPGALDGLRSSLRTFLLFRFFEPDVSKYIAYRTSQRLVMLDRETLVRTWSINEDYIKATGVALDESVSLHSAMSTLWQCAWNTEVSSLPRYFPDEQAGVRVAFGVISASNQLRPQFSDSDGGSLVRSEFWYGGASATMRGWFDVGNRRANLVKNYQSIHMASVGIVVKMRDEAMGILILGLYYDAELRMWVVDALNLNNYPASFTLSSIDF